MNLENEMFHSKNTFLELFYKFAENHRYIVAPKSKSIA